MELTFNDKYKSMTDKELVDAIISEPPDEMAATYLVYERYKPLLVKLYKRYIGDDMYWLDPCLTDVFTLLKGPELEWRPLKRFEWRSSLASYLTPIAKNHFLAIKPELIDNPAKVISMDDNNSSKTTMQIPDTTRGKHAHELMEAKIDLLDAIGKLEDEDSRLIIIKTLQGYKSRDIAQMIQERWDKKGIVKIYGGKRVVANEHYVNMTRNRIYKELKGMMENKNEKPAKP